MILRTPPQVQAIALSVATLATGSILAVAGHMHANLFATEAANDATLDARFVCSPIANTMHGIAGKPADICARAG